MSDETTRRVDGSTDRPADTDVEGHAGGRAEPLDAPSTPPLPKVELPPINRAPADRSTAGYLANTPGLANEDVAGAAAAAEADAGAEAGGGSEPEVGAAADATHATHASDDAIASHTPPSRGGRRAAVWIALFAVLAAGGAVVWLVATGSIG